MNESQISAEIQERQNEAWADIILNPEYQDGLALLQAVNPELIAILRSCFCSGWSNGFITAANEYLAMEKRK